MNGTIVFLATLVLASVLATAAEGSTENPLDEPVVKINNLGVKELNAAHIGDSDAHYQQAISYFKQAMAIDKSFSLARDNLAISYNNYGLYLRHTPHPALQMFHISFLIRPDNPTTQQNMEGIIRVMGRNPSRYADRIELAKAAESEGDDAGAVVEYLEALRLEKDNKIRQRLISLIAKLTRENEIFDSAWLQSQVPSEQSILPRADTSQIKLTYDRSAYFNEAFRLVHKNFSPPKNDKPYDITVSCRISSVGLVSELHLISSSRDEVVDRAALDAVTKSEPFPPLPEGAADSDTFEFHFIPPIPKSSSNEPSSVPPESLDH